MDFFATAAKGTEGALRDELRELRLPEVRADRGGVHFAGDIDAGFRACLGSRIAVRVLAWRGSFDAPSGNALYEGVRSLDWRHFLSPRHTLAVKATCRSSLLTHSQFVAQKTKDAIVDQLRDDVGARPSVDLADPDVLVVVHLVKDKADLYVDLAGEPLHRRGFRTRIGAAPLKETLAAAMLRLSGWDRVAPLADPMCGSGTIAIEAAQWSNGIAPGLSRKRFGFERWALFDDAMKRRMQELRAEARARVRAKGADVFASDTDPNMIQTIEANARDAGVDLVIEKRDVREGRALTPPGFVVTNPPYDERMATDEPFLREMARALLALRGHTIAILAGSSAIERAFARKPDKWWALFNGDIECRLLRYVL
jgi:putative N6-adenine-specific DNA methylase